MYGTASRCREIDRTKCNRPSDEHWPKQVAQALVVLIGLEAAMPYSEDMLCSQKIGPPLCGGVAHYENINATSGSKTRLTAIIRQHVACISRSRDPRTPDPKLERSMVIKVIQNPTLGRGSGG